MSYNKWKALIEEYEKSGKTQSQWCKERNLKLKAFNNHYRRYRTEKQNNEGMFKSAWMAIEFEAVIPSKLNIRIGKALIEIENGYDEKLLQAVVKSLEVIC